MNIRSCFNELEKLGAISPEQAQASLDRLQQLEMSRPTVGQAARYGLLGAVAGPSIAGAADLVRGQTPFKGVEREGKTIPYGRPRGVGGAMLAGALTSGAIPFVRSSLDRASEKRTLKRFLKEHEHTKTAELVPAAKLRAKGKLKEKDADSAMDFMASYDPGSFKVSPYSGPMSYGPWVLPSFIPYGEDKPLDVTVERKKHAASLTPTITGSPKAKLTTAQKVGQPKLTSPAGPTIADVSKPRGFGLPLPGALKGTI